MTRRKILFLATEDWFFQSHFLNLAERADADNFDVVIAAKLSGALAGLENARLIDMPFDRGTLRPWSVHLQVRALRDVLNSEQPDVVHAIALKPIALLLLTRGSAFARVLAITGRGYVGISRAPWARLVSWRLRRMLRAAVRAPRTVLLVENVADSDWVGVAGAPVVVMPGAGVDHTLFVPVDELASPPVVVGIVSRLIWSKGIDVAVDAVRKLRADGLDIVLRIGGGADLQNPEHVSETEIARWRSAPGVELLGPVTDVPGFWAGAHIACLPSRGGEGLPRSLIEAAACGRPIVTTRVPGCADFVQSNDAGLVVAPDDVDALAEALRALAIDKSKRQALGNAARENVLRGYTLEHAAGVASSAWALALDRGELSPP